MQGTFLAQKRRLPTWGTARMDHFRLDRTTDGDVRRLLASSTDQPRQRPDTGSGRLFPGRPRVCRCSDVDVTTVLLIFGPNVAPSADQTHRLRGYRRWHPCSVGRFLYPPVLGTGCPGHQSNSDRRSHFSLRHLGSDIRFDQHGLGVCNKELRRCRYAGRHSVYSI